MKTPNKKDQKIEVLAEKLLNKTITSEEFKQLEGWYAETPETPPVWNLKDESKLHLESRIFNSIQARMREPRRTIRLWKTISVAASLAVACGAGLWIWDNNQPAQIVQYVQQSKVGKITKVYLPDHSIVWLKGNSRLDYPSKFSDSTRNVTLHGEALFEVSKDKLHPFIIATDKYITKVLGTSFNIDATQQKFKLTVLTGKVAISDADRNQAKIAKQVIVTPGNEFEALGPEVTPKVVLASVSNKAQLLHGTEYDMNFESASFEEIKTRIEKKFNVILIADKSAYSNCNLSADVTDQSLDNTMKVLKAALSLSNYEINKNEVTLTGGGCN